MSPIEDTAYVSITHEAAGNERPSYSLPASLRPHRHPPGGAESAGPHVRSVAALHQVLCGVESQPTARRKRRSTDAFSVLRWVGMRLRLAALLKARGFTAQPTHVIEVL